jgi:hypothetical protein
MFISPHIISFSKEKIHIQDTHPILSRGYLPKSLEYDKELNILQQGFTHMPSIRFQLHLFYRLHFIKYREQQLYAYTSWNTNPTHLSAMSLWHCFLHNYRRTSRIFTYKHQTDSPYLSALTCPCHQIFLHPPHNLSHPWEILQQPSYCHKQK